MNKDVIKYRDKNGDEYTKESLVQSLQNYVEFSASVDFGTPGLTPGLYIGTFAKPDGYFHVNSAIKYGLSNAYMKYIKGKCGHCAKSVRLMLVAGGLDMTGNPVSAYQYASFLPQKGFKHIASLATAEDQAKWTSTNAQKGDIAVMAHGQHGHICMFTGDIWVSDFRQKNMWVYGGNGNCAIFRWGGKFKND